MITTAEIAPAPVLAPFVRCYTFREFDTNGTDLLKPWHAAHEMSMPFFFKAKPVELNNPQTGQILKGESNGGLVGLGTQHNGIMTFKGNYAFFEIVFRPVGFFKIFQHPGLEFTNHVFHTEEVFDGSMELFYEQLCYAQNLEEMGGLADVFLLSFLRKQKFVEYKDGITAISNQILKEGGQSNVEQLAAAANMSKRNFERRFTQQVGMGPKLFCCVVRFNQALTQKLRNPKKDWTNIALDCGYFDQMHLIKDFKKFAGSSPSLFLQQTPLTKETYSLRVED
ncbi:helix-turn-helix domain-containing protein [Rufibacter latericius]|uniref:AraC family transcriptional regulator n=1 Tax=Rufibacter latericius TaxID=2487040 RepID=A0A3M9MAZ2_9BACT|nr:AraC family transcriptional regulator [Rufibacter latericius]RNI22696.1 AraC family transcriptional regulator [Rufibacter latericius]